jgi:co-chaperonin GroES (HSP10)
MQNVKLAPIDESALSPGDKAIVEQASKLILAEEQAQARPLKCKISPLGDTIVVQPREKPSKTAAGLFLPETGGGRGRQSEVTGHKRFGIVLAIGPGKTNDQGVLLPMPAVKVGDEVVFSGALSIEPDGPDGPTVQMVPATALMGIIVREQAAPSQGQAG